MSVTRHDELVGKISELEQQTKLLKRELGEIKRKRIRKLDGEIARLQVERHALEPLHLYAIVTNENKLAAESTFVSRLQAEATVRALASRPALGDRKYIVVKLGLMLTGHS